MSPNMINCCGRLWAADQWQSVINMGIIQFVWMNTEYSVVFVITFAFSYSYYYLSLFVIVCCHPVLLSY